MRNDSSRFSMRNDSSFSRHDDTKNHNTIRVVRREHRIFDASCMKIFKLHLHIIKAKRYVEHKIGIFFAFSIIFHFLNNAYFLFIFFLFLIGAFFSTLRYFRSFVITFFFFFWFSALLT